MTSETRFDSKLISV